MRLRKGCVFFGFAVLVGVTAMGGEPDQLLMSNWGVGGALPASTNGSPNPGDLNSILRFAVPVDGTPWETLAVLNTPGGMMIGPDAMLYVTSALQHRVVRVNPDTGEYLGAFTESGSGGLDTPDDLTFGSDDNLYVGGRESDSVVRYNGQTGVLIDVFVTSGSGGLAGPRGLAFGPDGNLYVASLNGNEILRYDGGSGAFIDEFVSSETADAVGMFAPYEILFGGPDGNLYVGAYGGARVLRFDAATGAFIDTFVGPGSGGLGSPIGMAFSSEFLYVAGEGSDTILRYNAITGAFDGVFADLVETSTHSPRYLLLRSSAGPCTADLNGDGMVGGSDLALLLGLWGETNPVLPADLNGDGVVGGSDLAILLGEWGRCR